MAAAAAVVMLAISVAGRANAEEIVFWSNQAQPVEEAQRMREQVLAGFGKPVRYPAHDPGLYTLRNPRGVAGRDRHDFSNRWDAR